MARQRRAAVWHRSTSFIGGARAGAEVRGARQVPERAVVGAAISAAPQGGAVHAADEAPRSRARGAGGAALRRGDLRAGSAARAGGVDTMYVRRR